MEDDFLNAAQVEALLKMVRKNSHKLQILFLADAGLRVSEMIHLKWEHLDFRTKTLQIKSLKKRGEDVRRVVPMSTRLYESLAEYIDTEGKGDGYIFTKPRSAEPITRQAVNKMLKGLEEKNPELEDVHPHKLRHSFATSLRAHGAELEDIRDALGHKKLETSLIYAHADVDKLRTIIDAPGKKKLGFWEKLKIRLFGKKKKARVSVLEYDPNFTVGRENEVKKIEAALEKNISVVLVGGVGVGKTHLLNALRYKKTVLEVDDLKDFRKSLLNILLFLFKGDKEKAAKMLFEKSELSDLHKTINKDSVASLTDLLIQITGPKEYILKVGDIDTITPYVSRSLEKLKTHFTIVTSCREIKMNAFFIYDFDRIDVEPLSRIESMRLVHKLCSELELESIEHARNKIFDISQGNPKMIVELCTRLGKEDVLEVDTVNEICDNYIGRQTKEFDMSVILLLFMGGIMALRFLGKESDSPDLRMIGGLMMVVLMFARSFFRISRRTGL